MGQEISFSDFEPSDFEHFYQRLEKETRLLSKIISDKGCSTREPVAGFEIEAWILDSEMNPAPKNSEFLSSLNHPLVFPELAKFNIELNSPPMPLHDKVFGMMVNHLEETWNKAFQHASLTNDNLAMIGTLPTLQQHALSLQNMSDMNRYRALNTQILKMRGKPIQLDISGYEHLKLTHHDVMLESATTSLQIHIQLPLEQAHHFYNASLIASAPLVACSANSPFLFQKNLWHESRIPLFEQAIETGGYQGASGGPIKRVSFGTDYVRKSIMECFTENLQHFPVLLPANLGNITEAFEHLRLHNGTIWRWNRPLIGFDADGRPHIRIEHRTPAAGPTPIDSIANAAFYYGLSQNLSHLIMEQGIPLPFAQAKDNFYQAARYGWNHSITWLDGNRHNLIQLMKQELLPRALLGLQALGIEKSERTLFIDIIRQRLASQQTGCDWQRQMIQQQADFSKMTRSYLKHQQSYRPVGEWSLD
jgi:hypothetical protein